jgi:hypothetical protein
VHLHRSLAESFPLTLLISTADACADNGNEEKGGRWKRGSISAAVKLAFVRTGDSASLSMGRWSWVAMLVSARGDGGMEAMTKKKPAGKEDWWFLGGGGEVSGRIDDGITTWLRGGDSHATVGRLGSEQVASRRWSIRQREGFKRGNCAPPCSANQAPTLANRAADSRAPHEGDFSILYKPHFQLMSPFKIATKFLKLWENSRR